MTIVRSRYILTRWTRFIRFIPSRCHHDSNEVYMNSTGTSVTRLEHCHWLITAQLASPSVCMQGVSVVNYLAAFARPWRRGEFRGFSWGKL